MHVFIARVESQCFVLGRNISPIFLIISGMLGLNDTGNSKEIGQLMCMHGERPFD
jgi:hypothetical protein